MLVTVMLPVMLILSNIMSTPTELPELELNESITTPVLKTTPTLDSTLIPLTSAPKYPGRVFNKEIELLYCPHNVVPKGEIFYKLEMVRLIRLTSLAAANLSPMSPLILCPISSPSQTKAVGKTHPSTHPAHAIIAALIVFLETSTSVTPCVKK